MTPDELRVMDNNHCVIFIRGLYPFFATKYPLEKHPNYPYSGDGNKAYMFDVKKMLKTGENVYSLKDESKALKIYKEAQIADTREGERQYKQNNRKVQMTSMKGTKLHEVRPLSRDIPHLDIAPSALTPEQKAEQDGVTNNYVLEAISPAPKDTMDIIESELIDQFNGWVEPDMSFSELQEEEQDERGEH